MQDFEKLGVFYLGKPVRSRDATSRADNLLLYDSKDLVTHAVCVGMTGSGKTGLCIGLLEEAAIDGIPAIVDRSQRRHREPDADVSGTSPRRFRPWVNEGEARAKGISVDDLAAQQAELWKSGLADWGQDGDRIKRLQDAADIAIYTPGSEAGVPVSILQSFAAPDPKILADAEALRDRINATANSLLGLARRRRRSAAEPRAHSAGQHPRNQLAGG